MTDENLNHRPGSTGDPAPGAIGVRPPMGSTATVTAPGPPPPGGAGAPAPSSDPTGPTGPAGHPAGPSWQRRVGAALLDRPLRALVVGAVLAVVVGGSAMAVTLTRPPTYRSTTVMLIDDPLRLATAGDAGELSSLSALRLKYAALLSTDVMAAPVARATGLPVPEVLADVTTDVPLQSLLMDVTATTSSAATATRLSSAAAAEVTSYVKDEDSTFGIPANAQFSFTTIDPATPAAASPAPVAHALALGIGLAVLCLVLGFGLVQLVGNRRLLR